MKKRFFSALSLIIAAVMGFSAFVGCGDGKPVITPKPDDNPNNDVVQKSEYVSRVRALDGGKTYLEVDGKPFAIIGAQLRVDGFYNRSPKFQGAIPPLTDSEIERYFSAAKDFGINTLELALEWSQIETAKDYYDFTLADKLLSLTNKYGLKCEFLWFSTNMCGDTHSFTVPDYITDDTETYPVLEGKTYYSNMYGNVYHLVLNNENLMERERLVLEKLMSHVSEWNKANGEKNPLIGIQVHNESDGLLRWRLEQSGLKIDGKSISPADLWQMTLDALDNAGKTVHASDYKIYTRCNMTTSYGVNEFPQWDGQGFSPLDVLALDGIDIIGDDPYVTSPATISNIIKEYSVNGNYPHIAENMGNYSSSPSMFLSAYQAGGSYMFYDFATPEYFVQLNGNSSYQMDQGILNPDLSFKSHSQAAKNIVKGISAMGGVLPLVPSVDFAAFNISTEVPLSETVETLSTSNLSLTYTAAKGGIAFAIEYDGYVCIYSTEDCKFTVNNADITLKAEIGRFDGDGYITEEEVYINPVISVAANKLHKIKIRNVTG